MNLRAALIFLVLGFIGLLIVMEGRAARFWLCSASCLWVPGSGSTWKRRSGRCSTRAIS